MLRIVVTIDACGIVSQVRADGHAGFAIRGTDIVCAAVTVLLRTALRVLSCQKGIEVTGGGVGVPGQLAWEVTNLEKEGPWLEGVTTFLLKGLCDLEEEYPSHIDLEVKRKTRPERE